MNPLIDEQNIQTCKSDSWKLIEVMKKYRERQTDPTFFFKKASPTGKNMHTQPNVPDTSRHLKCSQLHELFPISGTKSCVRRHNQKVLFKTADVAKAN